MAVWISFWIVLVLICDQPLALLVSLWLVKSPALPPPPGLPNGKVLCLPLLSLDDRASCGLS